VPPRQKKANLAPNALSATDMAAEAPPPAITKLAAQVKEDGGVALASYRDPFAAQWVVLAALPIDKVEPTPYQRELSDTHAKRLAGVIPKVGRFLDPVIAVRHDGGYWTPNGMHRLTAMRRLGATAITALLLPEPEIAFRILALNTEKAHNLKDKSLEVIRMLRGLAAEPDTARRPESDWAFEFEEAAYPTIGICYEERPRFSGGAYLSIVKRCEEFSDQSVKSSLAAREKRAKRLLELDDAVAAAVDALKKAGFTSAYLKPFVVARVNPLRFIKAAKPGQPAPRAEFNATMDKMIGKLEKFDASKIKQSDIAAMGRGGGGEDED
jgi:ParB family chromosome partitioning protein